ASASFRAAWTRVGLVPDAGSAYFLPRIVGWGRATDMILTGEPVSADEALRIGLVTRVWSDAEFTDEWPEYARGLARGATEAYELAVHGSRAVLERTDSGDDQVDEVVFGASNQAGEDNRNVGRMAALLAGLPDSVPGVTVNRLCGSGLEAINDAARRIRDGEADIVIAGGVESLPRGPPAG